MSAKLTKPRTTTSSWSMREKRRRKRESESSKRSTSFRRLHISRPYSEGVGLTCAKSKASLARSFCGDTFHRRDVGKVAQYNACETVVEAAGVAHKVAVSGATHVRPSPTAPRHRSAGGHALAGGDRDSRDRALSASRAGPGRSRMTIARTSRPPVC